MVLKTPPDERRMKNKRGSKVASIFFLFMYLKERIIATSGARPIYIFLIEMSVANSEDLFTANGKSNDR
jgi:hypothetical protein